MNIKYNELSVVGKTWAVAEMFYYGVRDVNAINIEATYKKIDEMENNDKNSKTVKETSFANMRDSVEKILAVNSGKSEQEFIHDGSIVSTVWFDAVYFFNIKNNAKANLLTKKDYETLKEIYSEIKHIWVMDLKEKGLTSKERRDLFKIKDEILSLINNLENKIMRGNLAIG